MQGFMTPFKVGIVVLFSITSFIWMSSQVRKGMDDDESGYVVYALLDDVSGLAEKSRVTIAGIIVGQVDRIELAGNKARVWLRVNTPLRSDARIVKKQASLLGEYFIQLTPGYQGELLKDREEIKRVAYDVPPAEILNDLKGIAGNVVEITESLKNVMSGEGGGEQKLLEILENFRGTAQDLRTAVGGNAHKFDEVVANVIAITKEARTFTTDFRRDATLLMNDARAVTANVRSIVGDSTGDVQAGFEGIKGALGRMQSALDELEGTLENTRSITKKIDRGDGTLGKLVNDKRLYEDVNTLVSESGRFVQKITRLQTIVGMNSDYYFNGATVRNAFEVRLRPRPDKYYSLSLIDDPNGLTRFRETVTSSSESSSDPLVRQQQTVTEDRFRLSLQFARRYRFITGRIGIIENSGGLGIDLHGLNDKLEVSADLFAFDGNINPRMRLWSQYNFLSHVYLKAGLDEIWNENLTDFYMGFGIRFNDEDLKTVFTAAPAPPL